MGHRKENLICWICDDFGGLWRYFITAESLSPTRIFLPGETSKKLILQASAMFYLRLYECLVISRFSNPAGYPCSTNMRPLGFQKSDGQNAEIQVDMKHLVHKELIESFFLIFVRSLDFLNPAHPCGCQDRHVLEIEIPGYWYIVLMDGRALGNLGIGTIWTIVASKSLALQEPASNS